jgi:hypothetical protein
MCSCSFMYRSSGRGAGSQSRSMPPTSSRSAMAWSCI